jgi:hypothetical protein
LRNLTIGGPSPTALKPVLARLAVVINLKVVRDARGDGMRRVQLKYFRLNGRRHRAVPKRLGIHERGALRGRTVARTVAVRAAVHGPVDSGEADGTIIQVRVAAAVASQSNSRRGKRRPIAGR